jgi:hypothetical protein
MGFLDSTTNNIILDAVLTDTGRQFLAKNDGSFSIAKFALGDDEVNYNIIEKYGRTVGREKIEKNTPIFEGITNQSLAQKYKLISNSNPNLLKIPYLQLTAGGTSDTITLGSTTATSQTIRVEQGLQNETTIDVEFRDSTFLVELPNLFVQIGESNVKPTYVDAQQRATYLLPASQQTSVSGGSVLQFTLQTKSISSDIFTVYGTTLDKTIIKAYARISGMSSGAVLELTLNINKNS